MFDEEAMRNLVEQASAARRSLAAMLCLYRASALKDNAIADREVEGFSRLIDDSLDFCRNLVLGGKADGISEAMQSSFRNVLGPEDWPFEEPEGVAAWFIDVVSLAENSVLACASGGRDDLRCFAVLSGAYGLAGMLEAELENPSPHPLGELEASRQVADLTASAGVAGAVESDFLDSLISESAELREHYAGRFGDILERVDPGY